MQPSSIMLCFAIVLLAGSQVIVQQPSEGARVARLISSEESSVIGLSYYSQESEDSVAPVIRSTEVIEIYQVLSASNQIEYFIRDFPGGVLVQHYDSGQLLANLPITFTSKPVWSRDNSRVAIQVDANACQESEIAVVIFTKNTEITNSVCIPEEGIRTDNFAWSPTDSNYILVSDTLYDLESTDSETLTLTSQYTQDDIADFFGYNNIWWEVETNTPVAILHYQSRRSISESREITDSRFEACAVACLTLLDTLSINSGEVFTWQLFKDKLVWGVHEPIANSASKILKFNPGHIADTVLYVTDLSLGESQEIYRYSSQQISNRYVESVSITPDARQLLLSLAPIELNPTDVAPRSIVLNLGWAPDANAGEDRNTVDEDGDGWATLSLDGQRTSDIDDNIQSYEWYIDEVLIAVGVTPSVDIPIGTHALSLVVYDEDGLTDTDEVIVEVLPPVTIINCDVTISANNSVDLINTLSAPNSSNTICLADGTYTLTASNVVDYGDNGLPLITSDITLIGLGDNVVIERGAGAPAFRLLHVKDTGTLTLENLTLSNGNAGITHGGAVYARGALTSNAADVGAAVFSRADKLRIIQMLVGDLAAEEAVYFTPDATYEIISPYGNEAAVSVLPYHVGLSLGAVWEDQTTVVPLVGSLGQCLTVRFRLSAM